MALAKKCPRDMVLLMDAKSLIVELGDYALVAEKLGQPAGTVAAWKSRNKIPRTVWPDLLEGYPRKVTMARLRKTEELLAKPLV